MKDKKDDIKVVVEFVEAPDAEERTDRIYEIIAEMLYQRQSSGNSLI